jgi:hypothetical protein
VNIKVSRIFSCLDFVIPTEMKSSHLYVLFPFRHSGRHIIDNLSLLVNPVELGGLPGDNLTLLEPESNLLLGVLDGVGTVADVAADVDGEVATDGAGGRGKGVGSTEDGWISLETVFRCRTVLNLHRPVLTASRPSQTMAQMGPEFMYSMRPAKKGLPARSESTRMLELIDVKADCYGDEQCFSRCSLPGVMSLMATSLKLFKVNLCNSKRLGSYSPTVLETRDDGTNESTL